VPKQQPLTVDDLPKSKAVKKLQERKAKSKPVLRQRKKRGDGEPVDIKA